jgi:hypothetical protein
MNNKELNLITIIITIIVVTKNTNRFLKNNVSLSPLVRGRISDRVDFLGSKKPMFMKFSCFISFIPNQCWDTLGYFETDYNILLPYFFHFNIHNQHPI